MMSPLSYLPIELAVFIKMASHFVLVVSSTLETDKLRGPFQVFHFVMENQLSSTGQESFINCLTCKLGHSPTKCTQVVDWKLDYRYEKDMIYTCMLCKIALYYTLFTVVAS